jgi:hypothetical protein
MSVVAMKTRQWAVVGATLAIALAATLAFGGTPTPCAEVYPESGLTQQQMTFGEFRELYGDTICSPQ